MDVDEPLLRSLAINLGETWDRLNRLSRGRLAVIADALMRFNEARATEAAAGIAYYTLFSLFPLLLILVAIGGAILAVEPIQQQILDLVSQTFPPARDLVERNLYELIQLSRPVGIIAAIGLAWAASSVFTILALNIERAWSISRRRDFLKMHLLALAMAGSMLAGLLILSLLSTAMLSLLAVIKTPVFTLFEISPWALLPSLVPWILMFITAFCLYLLVPGTRVRSAEAGWGAISAATLWWMSNIGFSWYIQSGLSRYHLIYGSLGTVVIFMLWIYLTSLIILLGAHISAAMGRAGGGED